LFLRSRHDQTYTATYFSDGRLELNYPRSDYPWIFKYPNLLYEGKKCQISWADHSGYATLDEYGSISIKHWASAAEEKKNFVFTKVPKTLRDITDLRTLRPILARLYVKSDRNKKPYKPRKKYSLKKERNPGAGRKVRNIALEKYILSNLEAGIMAGRYPNRKSSIFLAKQWKVRFGSDKYDGFKVSKGWCDKFMKRNKVQLKK
jgi:hypothetical protein